MNQTQLAILELARYDIWGEITPRVFENIDWKEAFEQATAQGLSAIALDGINKCFEEGVKLEIDFQTKMDWIGQVTQMEQRYQLHEKNIRDLGAFYQKHGIKMMVLKGYGLSKNYPVPSHRPCGDIDIYLFGKQKAADAALLNLNDDPNHNIKIDTSHHHHTVFQFQGETVENHYDFLNVHVRPSNKRIEKKLKELANVDLNVNDNENDNQNADNIFFPSVEFNAIYLLRHCAGHFASTEMSVRQVLDWGLFMKKHHKEIKWDEYLLYLKEERMYRFYNLMGLFCMTYLGFDASIFHGLYSDNMLERFGNEILEPEFKDHENGKLLHSLSVKPRRWWHNRWKNRLCYKESAWEEFVYGLWAKVLKPSHFWQ